MYKCKFFLILFLISFPFFSYSNDGATGIIKERMNKFQESKNLMRTINKSLSDNNFDVITQSAEKLNKWANEMHGYFPKGSEASTSNKSQASDNIWSDPEGFKKAVKKFEITSAKLIKISQNKNIDDTVSSFREVAASCKGCHKQFRN
jgi:cytochrome c556